MLACLIDVDNVRVSGGLDRLLGGQEHLPEDITLVFRRIWEQVTVPIEDDRDAGVTRPRRDLLRISSGNNPEGNCGVP